MFSQTEIFLTQDIYKILDIYGLNQKKSEYKFIPEEYKYNSKAVRIALLKGLLDADGTVSNGKIELVLSSKRMIEDVRWICASLGIPCTDIRIKKTWYYGKNKEKIECLNAYRLSIFSSINIFNLPRKISQWTNRSKTNYAQSKYKGYKITNITYLGEQQAKCVTVDNESHCYLINEFIVTHNSYMGAGLLAKRFKLGENQQVREKVLSTVTASDKKYIYGPNQILNMFKYYIDFQSQHTQFPRQMLTDSAQLLMWESGFKDKETGVRKGTQNAVIGVTTGVNQDKLNGSRGVLYLIEEAGIFNNLNSLYQMIRPSVEDGKDVYGLIFMYGCVCAGTKVWTLDGRCINIEDLKKEDGIIGHDAVGVTKEPIGTIITPHKKECLRLTFSDNSILECSTDHPILVQNKHSHRINKKGKRIFVYLEGFNQASNLKIGDRVCKARKIDIFGTDTLWDARLVGMLIGDGSYGFNNTPKYSSEDIELLEYVKSKYEWGYSAKPKKTTKNKIYEEIRIKNICSNLREIGIYGQVKEYKRLPNNYQTLTKENTINLLGGLFDTDGCVSVNKEYSNISLTQSNQEILKEVKILLKKFGITSTITYNKPSIKEGRKDKKGWYRLTLRGRINIQNFYDNIHLLVKEKQSKLEEIIKWYNINPSTKPCNYDTTMYNVVKVKKIEKIGIQTIYNLSAMNSHTYLANDIITHNTAGDDMSDFTSLQEIMYNPDGYNMEKNLNVWDKEGQGRKWFTFFYPAYLNRANCMDENGNSDVTKALLEICQDRYTVKYNSSDINAITKRISQYPITPQEAIIRAHATIFPVTELNERLNQIDNNPNFYNDTYVGNLVFNDNGEVEFAISNDKPIRDFPTKDNKVTGAIEIFTFPEKDSNGKIPNERYIAGSDPYDDDTSNTMSLGSFFVLDTWTDTIAMEYTGRPPFANDYFEICRKGCLFYNAKLMYEAHPYSQEVRLPNGETKLWKDVKVGDYLFAPNGNITKVIDIPMDGEDDIYRITLADGRQVEASSNHKWIVNKSNHKDKVYEVTTQEMYNAGIKNKHGQTNFFIPESGAVHYPYKEPVIDPYTLGLLIAEGALTKFKKNKYENFKRNYVQISSSREDMEIYKTLIPYPVKYIGTKGFSWHLYIEDIDLKLAELNLLHCNSHTKFIPFSYLVNSYKVRLQLLKGLMDGDGCATKSGAAVYITTSEKLAKDITILCRSLGIKASLSKPKKSVYRVTIISTISVFNLPRKQKKQHVYTPYTKGSKASAYLYKTAIQNIEYIGRQKCKCITVDRADGLYLIGDYITTHNCNKKGLFSYFSMMNSSYLLANTPEYLKDKQLIKDIGYGNKSYGINALTNIKSFGYQKIRDWLLTPYTKIEKDQEGHDIEVSQANLYRIKNRALLKELILWNPNIN